MAVLFLIVFVDLVGFGLLIPLLPFYVERTGVGPEIITLVLGLYSLAQFIAAPLWGRLSDIYGRKPVLAATSFGLAASYVILAYADTLTLLIAARAFGGLMAGNIAAAHAYVSDVTTPETRAKGMGIVGAAFGLGFIVGPAMGGVLGGSDLATADFFTPAIVAAAITFAAATGAVFFLKESLNKDIRAAQPRMPFTARWKSALTHGALMLLISAGFLAITAWALFETVFALWANAVFNYGPAQIGYVLTFMGVVSALVQGVAIGPLARRYGERKLARTAMMLLIVGYIVIAMTVQVPIMAAACGVLAVGSALLNPAMTSLVSQEAAPHERGAVLGVYQSATALSRVVGPAVSGALFAWFGQGAPFLVAAGLVLPALALVAVLTRRAAEKP